MPEPDFNAFIDQHRDAIMSIAEIMSNVMKNAAESDCGCETCTLIRNVVDSD